MPKIKDESGVKSVYNIFWLGPEGFGEHVQIELDDLSQLAAVRQTVNDTLKEISATPLPRDRVFASKAVSAPVDGMAAAASEMFGATLDVPASIPCPVDGRPMVLVRNINGKIAAGKTKPWPDFYSCDKRNGGCAKTVNARNANGG